MTFPLALYTHVLGAIEATGFVYLLYRYRDVFERHRYFFLPAAGLLLVVLVETFIDRLDPVVVHSVHTFAAAVIAVGLGALLVHETADNWSSALFRRSGDRPDWMTRMDDEILTYLDASDAVLSPGLIAVNLEYSRESVNRHLRRLEDHDFVDRIERGKYRLAEEAHADGGSHSLSAMERRIRGVLRRVGSSIVGRSRPGIGADQKSGR